MCVQPGPVVMVAAIPLQPPVLLKAVIPACLPFPERSPCIRCSRIAYATPLHSTLPTRSNLIRLLSLMGCKTCTCGKTDVKGAKGQCIMLSCMQQVTPAVVHTGAAVEAGQAGAGSLTAA